MTSLMSAFPTLIFTRSVRIAPPIFDAKLDA
ncbi:hypothetical protein CPL00146S_CDS0089 [Escherichia phage SmurfNell]|uniref:Uncharacterized protein n=1 Tax=Salmonella phage PMBT27 TaxID=3137285 RepID=A0AAU8BTR8_9VIRU